MSDPQAIASAAADGAGAARPLDHLLSRPIDAATLARNTEAVAAPLASAAGAGETLIFFERASELLALPAVAATRVFAPLKVHHVPFRSGGAFRGVVSERGELRLCASLEVTLGLRAEAAATDEARRRMMVLEVRNDSWVFEVDAVLAVRPSPRAGWTEPPVTVSRSAHRLTVHLVPFGERLASLLDPDRLAGAFAGAIS